MAQLNKEMVDLATKIKKHLRDKHQISIALADPELLDKLVALKSLDDPLLQGMLRYLMALAGPRWSERFDNADEAAPDSTPGAAGKRLFGLYRGKAVSAREGERTGKSAEEKRARTRYRGRQPGDWDKPGEAAAEKERKPVRYYRGQPIYDDD